MTSIRHNDVPNEAPSTSADDGYLEAARDAILAVGWSRTTLTDIARLAGVSRMTLYRRWPDTQALVADLMSMASTGRIHPVEPSARPLAEAAATLDDLQHRRIAGKVVLTCTPAAAGPS